MFLNVFIILFAGLKCFNMLYGITFVNNSPFRVEKTIKQDIL